MNKQTILSLITIAMATPCTVLSQVPAVMYHAHENLGYVEQDFRDHMEFLAENEFTGIDMDQFYEWHQNDAILPYRPIILTVDDNYILGYTSMYPILVETGMVAINYAHTRGIGIGAPKASWAQIREMDESGFFLVESHSQTHPQLTQIPPA
ncbi:MAG: polysaccharide deacetylase family protein, partial [Candidatus Sumerlaeia bacterium]|nr:polysaccharide deacetylase family protein [Candidatus Sumerlaeia bacterium]